MNSEPRDDGAARGRDRGIPARDPFSHRPRPAHPRDGRVATLRDGALVGRGECTPYARYGESPERVRDAIAAMADEVRTGLDTSRLQTLMPAGAARNALDCALWDLAAKRLGRPVWDLAGLTAPIALPTARTVFIAAPAEIAEAAMRLEAATIKVKLGGRDSLDADRIRAVRAALPGRRVVVDANEGWSEAELPSLLDTMARAEVARVEQPFPAQEDHVLRWVRSPVPLCADESAHTRADLEGLRDRYEAVKVKLDKTGGLTEAIAMVAQAHRLGFSVMIGCMLCSSLAIAPTSLLAGQADFVDLNGPTWLARDRVVRERVETVGTR